MMEYTNGQIQEAIAEHIHSARDRQILSSRLIDGLTFEQLSKLYDMSPRQIKNIVYKLKEIVFRHIPA